MKITVGHLKRLIGESMGDEDDYEAQMAAMAKRWEEEENRPEVKPFLDAIRNAQDPKELARAKRALVKADDAGNPTIMAGVWTKIYNEKKKELDGMRDEFKRNADPSKANADARMDRLLRIQTSSGKATPRKF